MGESVRRWKRLRFCTDVMVGSVPRLVWDESTGGAVLAIGGGLQRKVARWNAE